MLSLLLSTSCLLDISTNIVRISLLGFSFVASFREQHCLFPHCLMTNIPTWRLKNTGVQSAQSTKNPVFPSAKSAKNLKVDHPRN